jgi:hypothetical protein
LEYSLAPISSAHCETGCAPMARTTFRCFRIRASPASPTKMRWR